ncbi:MAG: helix-turn-helix domain-containing protein [Spirulinaceae cyanobacterium]
MDKSAYCQLLNEVVPTVIENEKTYQHFLAISERLVANKNLSLAEQTLLKLLATLIEVYEAEHHPLGEASPQAVLNLLMESQDISAEALVGLIGSPEVVDAVIKGDRPIDLAQAKALGDYFQIAPTVFISDRPAARMESAPSLL